MPGTGPVPLLFIQEHFKVERYTQRLETCVFVETRTLIITSDVCRFFICFIRRYTEALVVSVSGTHTSAVSYLSMVVDISKSTCHA